MGWDIKNAGGQTPSRILFMCLYVVEFKGCLPTVMPSQS